MPLSEAQTQAIDHFTGPAIVLAGPGSGKTTVITQRTVKLVQDYHVPAEHILVVTFTRAAAEEMKGRYLSLRGEKQTAVRFGTFHSVFFQILKAAYHFTAENIVSEERKYGFLKEIVRKLALEIDDEADFLKSITQEIGIIKSERINISHYYSTSISEDIFRKIYKMYENRMEKENLIDYDDIILFTWELLSQREDILDAWRNKYQFILIDEFQDINKLQYDIMKLLTGEKKNLFIVGDDDQSIYRFRGAKPEIMLHFEDDFPGTKKILLDQNFRCPDTVVRIASRLISNNISRFDKAIRSVHSEGESVHFQLYQNQTRESIGIIQLIQKYRQRGYSYSQMAVLYRNNTDARIISQRFLEYNIPICMRDALPNMFEHWIALNIIHYLQAARGNRDRSLFLQIMNKPKRYLQRESINDRQVDFEKLRCYYNDKLWMIQRIDQFELDLLRMGTMDPYTAINYLRHVVGYEEYLSEYASYRKISQEELSDIADQIQESTRGFKTIEEWFIHIKEYGEMLKEQVKQKKYMTDAVTFSTLHSSKGLEYPIVFIIDVNDGIIPYKKALMEADVEEERRMFYVGITRAKEILHICSIKEKNGKDLKPSPFLIGLES